MDGCTRQDPAYRPATERPRFGGAFLLRRCGGARGARRYSTDWRPSVCTSSTSSPVPTRAARRCSCSSTRGSPYRRVDIVPLTPSGRGAPPRVRCGRSDTRGRRKADFRHPPGRPARHRAGTRGERLTGSPRTTGSPATSTRSTRTRPCFRPIPSACRRRGDGAVGERTATDGGAPDPGCGGGSRARAVANASRRRPDGIPPLQARAVRRLLMPWIIEQRLPIQSRPTTRSSWRNSPACSTGSTN